MIKKHWKVFYTGKSQKLFGYSAFSSLLIFDHPVHEFKEPKTNTQTFLVLLNVVENMFVSFCYRQRLALSFQSNNLKYFEDLENYKPLKF
jgi:hypothetical protein